MSAGGQSQKSSSASQSFIDPMQQGFLSNLWTTAQQNIRPGATAAEAQRAAQPGAAAAQTGLNTLTGIMGNPLAGQTSVLARLGNLGNVDAGIARNQPALTTLRDLMNPTAQIGAQSRSLKSGLGELFREELNPAIKGSAIAAGGFGGGRQGVAQGQAVGELADSYTQGLGDIVAGANAQAAGAAGSFSSILQNIMGQATQANAAEADVRGNAQSRAMGAAQLIPGLGTARQAFGTAGTNAMQQALQALASIYGSPTLLTQAQSGGKGSGWSFGFGS